MTEKGVASVGISKNTARKVHGYLEDDQLNTGDVKGLSVLRVDINRKTREISIKEGSKKVVERSVEYEKEELGKYSEKSRRREKRHIK